MRSTLALLFVLSTAYPVKAQSPSFDVVCVKLVPIGGNRVVSDPDCQQGRFFRQGSVLASIRFAFNLPIFELPALPGWTNQADGFYEIDARASAPATTEQCRAMVRALLADRFGLAVHRASKDISVNALSVPANGSKLTRATDADEVVLISNGSRLGSPSGKRDQSKGWTTQYLAEFASAATGSPVVDKTGLEGVNKIHLVFSRRPPGFQGTLPDDTGVDLLTAIRQQLGLRIEQQKEPMQILIIDHIERPSAN